jgi:hypothetical protein
MAVRTVRNVSCDSFSGVFSARDTVIADTPAARATSSMRTLSGGGLRLRGGGLRGIEEAGEGLAVLDSHPSIRQHEMLAQPFIARKTGSEGNEAWPTSTHRA